MSRNEHRGASVNTPVSSESPCYREGRVQQATQIALQLTTGTGMVIRDRYAESFDSLRRPPLPYLIRT